VLIQLCPTVAVAILTFTMFRRDTRRELWRSIGLGRAGVRSWGWAFGLPILLSGGVFGILLLVGAGDLRALPMAGSTVVSFATGSVLLLAGLIVTMSEEIGWRGFMLPRIQQLTGKRRAALVTGFAHGCFHLPLILIASTYDSEGSRWIAAPAAVLLITVAGVFYAWLRDRSGSVWPVAIGHTFGSTTFSWGLAVVVPNHLDEPERGGGTDRHGHPWRLRGLRGAGARAAEVGESLEVRLSGHDPPRVDDATREQVEA
jgi:membrane protease YdiL (CAAX protease family)